MKYEFRLFRAWDITWKEYHSIKYWLFDCWASPGQAGIRFFGIYLNLMWRNKVNL